MKRLISLILLVKVGSNLWVNPAHVVGVKANDAWDADRSCRTYIFVESGTDIGANAYVCSDWDTTNVVEKLGF